MACRLSRRASVLPGSLRHKGLRISAARPLNPPAEAGNHKIAQFQSGKMIREAKVFGVVWGGASRVCQFTPPVSLCRRERMFEQYRAQHLRQRQGLAFARTGDWIMRSSA